MQYQNTIEEAYSCLVKTILQAAEKNISKTFSKTKKKKGNGVNGSLFENDLAIYITTRSQRTASRALQGVTKKLDAWAAERGLTFSSRKTVSMTFKKRNEEPIEIMLRNKIIPSKEST